MGVMFFGASVFNPPLSFDTSSVSYMYYMFYSAAAFNQPLSFDTSSVTDMSYMFWVRFSPSTAPVCSRALPMPLAPLTPATSHLLA